MATTTAADIGMSCIIKIVISKVWVKKFRYMLDPDNVNDGMMSKSYLVGVVFESVVSVSPVPYKIIVRLNSPLVFLFAFVGRR